MRDSELLTRERAAKDIIASASPTVLGARIRRERLAQQMSIRSLAEAANLGPNSIVRLEAGKEFRPVTLVKVCAALGLHLDRIGFAENDAAAVHHHADDCWHWLDGYAAGPMGGGDGRMEAAQRRAEAKKQGDSPLMLLRSRLAAGKMLPTLIEVHFPTQTRSHPGEEFLYVLQGQAVVTVAGQDYRLEQGESMEFWGTEPHAYAPAGEGPALILSVRVNP